MACYMVSDIMSSEQKFHKEAAYEAAVRSATHSPCYKVGSQGREMLQWKSTLFLLRLPHSLHRDSNYLSDYSLYALNVHCVYC